MEHYSDQSNHIGLENDESNITLYQHNGS